MTVVCPQSATNTAVVTETQNVDQSRLDPSGSVEAHERSVARRTAGSRLSLASPASQTQAEGAPRPARLVGRDSGWLAAVRGDCSRSRHASVRQPEQTLFGHTCTLAHNAAHMAGLCVKAMAARVQESGHLGEICLVQAGTLMVTRLVSYTHHHSDSAQAVLQLS